MRHSSTNLTMESLRLPKELYWDDKVVTSALLADDNTLFDNLTNELLINTTDSFDTDSHHEVHSIDDTFVLITLNDTATTVIATPSLLPKAEHIVDVNCFGFVEASPAVLTQLTPPQSPPYEIVSSSICNAFNSSDGGDLSNEQRRHEVHDEEEEEEDDEGAPNSPASLRTPSLSAENFVQQTWSSSNFITIPPKAVEEIERETQIVDDIVKTRAQELANWDDDSMSMFSSSSPSTLSTTDEECQSSCLSVDFNSQDYAPGLLNGGENVDDKFTKSSSPLLVKKHTRPYGRGVEDRKIRKKEQNKNAATRYRQKKKRELETVLTEEQKLTMRNEELKRILADRTREAKYLKTLIREFYKKPK